MDGSSASPITEEDARGAADGEEDGDMHSTVGVDTDADIQGEDATNVEGGEDVALGGGTGRAVGSSLMLTTVVENGGTSPRWG